MEHVVARSPDLDGHGVRVWFLEPATMVNQVYVGKTMSVPIATFIINDVEKELQRRFVSRGAKVRYVHDWRACIEYEPQARQMLLDWGRRSRPHTQQVTISLSPQASPFMQIAANSAVTLLRIAGMKISLANDFELVSRELRALSSPPLSGPAARRL